MNIKSYIDKKQINTKILTAYTKSQIKLSLNSTIDKKLPHLLNFGLNLLNIVNHTCFK